MDGRRIMVRKMDGRKDGWMVGRIMVGKMDGKRMNEKKVVWKEGWMERKMIKKKDYSMEVYVAGWCIEVIDNLYTRDITLWL